MSRVNTKDKIMQAALKLFVELGYQKTSIARIESEAGLVPRAGAFYRHFDGKQTLLFEVAKAYVSETPDDFGLESLADFDNTRAELITIAKKYEAAAIRQQPYARLIEEVRLLEFGAELQSELDGDMLKGLAHWIAQKPGAKDLAEDQIFALLLSIFGGWIFYLTMMSRTDEVAALRDTMLGEWATRWAKVLDESPSRK